MSLQPSRQCLRVCTLQAQNTTKCLPMDEPFGSTVVSRLCLQTRTLPPRVMHTFVFYEECYVRRLLRLYILIYTNMRLKSRKLKVINGANLKIELAFQHANFLTCYNAIQYYRHFTHPIIHAPPPMTRLFSHRSFILKLLLKTDKHQIFISHIIGKQSNLKT